MHNPSFKPCLTPPATGQVQAGFETPLASWQSAARRVASEQIVAAGYKIGEAIEGAIPHPLFFGMTQEGQKRDSGYAFYQKAYPSVKEYV
jgi:hypothetical protein